MPIKTLRNFIKLESSAGIILFSMAVLAIIFDNSPLRQVYQTAFNASFGIELGVIKISKPLLLWINDGLMVLFFLLVGLEVKRELFEGELSTVSQAILPAIAAIGGMVVPALIYLAFNHGNTSLVHGWAIPTATDIAFSLGILALLRSRIPVSLKIFLTALAIFDDIGAIIIIAMFYTKDISLLMLSGVAVLTLVLFLFNRFRVNQIGPYLIVGVALWLCVLKSGVHATLAGIIVAFAIPLRDFKHKEISPVRIVENALHPWVAFGVLPVFAFANAGVSLDRLSLGEFISPITLGIAVGLFVGKQLGVWLFSMVAIKTGLARMIRGANSLSIYGIGLIAGVGFTMSLFIGGLAFGQLGRQYMELVRLGVIIGSLLSGVCGFLVLYLNHPPHNKYSESE